jgi:hypothetical protein
VVVECRVAVEQDESEIVLAQVGHGLTGGGGTKDLAAFGPQHGFDCRESGFMSIDYQAFQ